MTLQRITAINSWAEQIIKDDPVRPEIGISMRINRYADMWALWEDEKLCAVCCVSYTQDVPHNVNSMFILQSMSPDTVVFYTIWSYSRGSGRELIQQATPEIKKLKPTIKNVVTLSPQTEMARKFHLSNGAHEWRVNNDTINYAYEINQ